ncbi:MAG: hypothetical protein K0S33_3367 [Bacteroidetes bacterium]|jgi:hypothetical protein|nr:hypothetical protein [Bacteroidota bacterium]
MIKRLLSIAFVAGTFALAAQPTNLGFETWAGGTPSDWSAPFAPFVSGSITQITSGAPEGSSAIQLTSGSCPFCVIAGYPDRMPGFIVQSVASTDRPVSMTLMMQADVMGTDEALMAAQLTKWDGATTNIIGQAGGTIPGGTVISTWTAQTINFTYMDPGNPDTLSILAASSDSILLQGATSNPTIGSTISIDAIVINNPVGIQDVIFYGSKHIAYPNPASTEINFATSDDNAAFVTVYDVTGRAVVNLPMVAGKAKMDVDMLESGMYMYSITDASKGILYTHKFNIAK